MTDNSREGWIELPTIVSFWSGQMVDLKFRDGEVIKGQLPRMFDWQWSPNGDAPDDIIAYRVVTAADDRGDGYEAPSGVVSPDLPDELAMAIEPNSALSRSPLPTDILVMALGKICSGDVISVGERRIHAENLIAMATDRLASQEETIRAAETFMPHAEVAFLWSKETPPADEVDRYREAYWSLKARLSARQEGGLG